MCVCVCAFVLLTYVSKFESPVFYISGNDFSHCLFAYLISLISINPMSNPLQIISDSLIPLTTGTSLILIQTTIISLLDPCGKVLTDLLTSTLLLHNNESSVYAELYPTPWDPMDCSLLGSSVPGILKARIWSGLPIPLLIGIFPTQR